MWQADMKELRDVVTQQSQKVQAGVGTRKHKQKLFWSLCGSVWGLQSFTCIAGLIASFHLEAARH